MNALRFRIYKPIAQRLDEKTAFEPMSGCWLWTGYTCKNGYGRLGYRRADGVLTARTVHALAYEQVHGPIPEGLQIDHLCRNRCCINPDHLEAVTPFENTHRGIIGDQFRKKICKNGHPRNSATIAPNKNGTRRCLLCCAMWQARAREKLAS